MTPVITLIVDPDCPNVAEARAVLREALERAGLELRWIERTPAAAGVPEPFPGYGSPTILVDGVDVAGEAPEASAACCRVYRTGSGFQGIPPLDVIVGAINRRRDAAPEEPEGS